MFNLFELPDAVLPYLDWIRLTAQAAGALIGFWILWRLYRWGWPKLLAAPENALTVVAAAIATGVSAQGMWRFSGDVLGLDGPLRLLLFAFIEVAIITSAVRARRNMRENFSAGIDGIAVWTLTALTAVLSSMDARSLPEAVFRLAAPLVAAWLWERGMAIERHRIRGTGRINWRLTPERLLVRIGLAEAKDRTASEVDVHRRLTRVALGAKRVHQLRQASAKPRKLAAALARRDRRLDEAVEHTDLATNPITRAQLLDIATTLGGGDSITEILAAAPAPWHDLDHPAVTGRRRHSDALQLAAALDRNTATRRLAELPEEVALDDRSETGPGLGTASPGDGAVLPQALVEGRSWRMALLPWTRPVAVDGGDPDGAQEAVAEADAPPVAEDDGQQGAVAGRSRPVADREKPTEQDRRRAIRFYINRAKKLNPPSKRTLAEWTGFSETWALGCIQEGRRIMAREGWTFDDKGVPQPPRPVAGPDATAASTTTGGGTGS